MARILAVGNATLDIINLVDRYPQEDQEVRAQSQQQRRGGNSANTLVVLSQLGHDCAWAGTLAAEPDANLIRHDLAAHGIELSAVHTTVNGKVPTSYVTLSRESGSRTIVHYRDLPEYHSREFARIDLERFDWIHFEGRNLEQVRLMLARVQRERPELRCSLEVEKPRPGIEALFAEVGLLMFSKEYAQHQGCQSAAEFLEQMARRGVHTEMSCTWGEEGAYGLSREGQILHTPAFPPPKVIDTLGAGDVFNAGLIDQRLRGCHLEVALTEAARLAGKKCGVYGLNDLLDR
jgi:ketohexokinase